MKIMSCAADHLVRHTALQSHKLYSVCQVVVASISGRNSGERVVVDSLPGPHVQVLLGKTLNPTLPINVSISV